jgi:ABC-type proline/glycine betaine transport system substrate-binding protein
MNNQINIGGQNNPPVQTGKLSTKSKIIVAIAFGIVFLYVGVIIFSESKDINISNKNLINSENTKKEQIQTVLKGYSDKVDYISLSKGVSIFTMQHSGNDDFFSCYKRF